jgi:hypothetical protein
MRGFQPLLHGRLLELLGASTQLAICSEITTWSGPYLQDAISSSPPLQLSRKVVGTRSEHSSQSAHTLQYVRTHPGTIAERNLLSAKLARLCGDSRPHWVQTEKAEIPSWLIFWNILVMFVTVYMLWLLSIEIAGLDPLACSILFAFHCKPFMEDFADGQL